MNIVAKYILQAYKEESIDWNSMSQQERSEYLKQHPNSKYSNKGNNEKRRRYQRLLKDAQQDVKDKKEVKVLFLNFLFFVILIYKYGNHKRHLINL